jgi:hypothetical protein
MLGVATGSGSQPLDPDDGAACCAEVRYLWRCQECGRLAVKFVVPFRLCPACGSGPLWVVAQEGLVDPQRTEPVREAVQLGVEIHHFYRLALDQTIRHEQVMHRPTISILAELCARQRRELHELMARYCVSGSVLELSPAEREVLSRELFRGIDFMVPAGLVELYRRALALERRSLAHGERRALCVPRGAVRQLYWQLADEAAERAGLLEAELDFLDAHAADESNGTWAAMFRRVDGVMAEEEVMAGGRWNAGEEP